MDLDIWGPPYDSVAEDGSLCTPVEWLFDFYYVYRFDVIEEDALNEKCCIQVLRILITKADTEIDKLEQDLILLQSELAWIENQEWSEIGSNALTEKINCLDFSLKSLINKDKDDVEVLLLMHTQPVERLNEILKALLSNYFCKKDVQPKKFKVLFVLNLTFTSPREANNIMDGNTKLGSCSSKTIGREEMRGSGSTTVHAVICSPSLKFHKEIVKPANAEAKGSSSCSLKLAAGFSDVGIRSNNSSPKNTQMGKGRKHGFSSRDQRVVQISSSNSENKGKCGWEEIKIQPANVGVNNAISDAWKHADDSSIKMKIISKSGLAIVSEEFEERSSVSAAGVVLDPSVKPVVKKTGPADKVKHADFGKNIAAKELSCATGLSERNGNANSGLGPFSNPDDWKKLIDFTLNAATQQSMKELKVASSKKVVSSNSSVKTEEKERNLPQMVKVVEAALTETENSALTLLLEQQDKKGKKVIKLLPTEETKTMPENKMSETAADEKKFNMNMSLNLLKEKTKRSINSNSPTLHEAGFSTAMANSSSSLATKAKKRKNSLLRPPVQLGECESEDSSASPDEIPDSVSPLLKKTKSLKSPFISNFEDFPLQMKFSTSKRDSTDCPNKDNLSVTYSICDSISEAAASVPYSTLEKMKLADLQRMAKQCGLTKYSKLSKKALLQLLAGSICDSRTP